MSDDILSFDVFVDKVVETNGEDLSFKVTLKGQKTVAHDRNGYSAEDVVKFTITAECGMRDTIESLGIDEHMARKIIAMRGRDCTIQGFESKLIP